MSNKILIIFGASLATLLAFGGALFFLFRKKGTKEDYDAHFPQPNTMYSNQNLGNEKDDPPSESQNVPVSSPAPSVDSISAPGTNPESNPQSSGIENAVVSDPPEVVSETTVGSDVEEKSEENLTMPQAEIGTDEPEESASVDQQIKTEDENKPTEKEASVSLNINEDISSNSETDTAVKENQDQSVDPLASGNLRAQSDDTEPVLSPDNLPAASGAEENIPPASESPLGPEESKPESMSVSSENLSLPSVGEDNSNIEIIPGSPEAPDESQPSVSSQEAAAPEAPLEPKEQNQEQNPPAPEDAEEFSLPETPSGEQT